MNVNRPHSNASVDRAGRILTHSDSDEAHSILSTWRALHASPLRSVALMLTDHATQVDPEAIVAQRLKRFPSIRQKLLDRPQMALTQMQDVAGCRAVVATVEDVYAVKRIYEQQAQLSPSIGPELIHKWTKDYILEPKDDGYRSLHLVFKYHSESEEAAPCHGLRVEVQVRSRLQHAWAMAVETASSLTHQALKAGKGREEWQRFFRLIGSAIALKENLPIVPYTPDETSLFQEIRMLSSELRVIPLFEGMSHVVENIGPDDLKHSDPEDLYLLQLNAEEQTFTYLPFGKERVKEAVTVYDSMERKYANNPNVHVVLVSVGSITNLREAYPSYFLDTTAFVDIVKSSCDEGLFSSGGLLDSYGNVYYDDAY